MNPSAPASTTNPPATSAPPTLECLVSWANQELGLSEPTDRRQLRSVVLDRLQSDSWLSAPSIQRAFEVLAHGPEGRKHALVGPDDGLYFLAAEKRRRDSVETFAQQFFDLPPDERRNRWNALFRECADFPRLAHRLNALKPGLNAYLPESPDDASLRDLSRHLGELFTATPVARARKRLTPSTELAGTMAQWSAAARRLKQSHPQVAALDAKCLTDLSFGLSGAVPGASAKPNYVATPPRQTSQDGGHRHTVEGETQRRSSSRRSRRPRFSKVVAAGGGGIILVVVLFIGRLVFRLLSADSNPQPSPPSPVHQHADPNPNSSSRPPEIILDAPVSGRPR